MRWSRRSRFHEGMSSAAPARARFGYRYALMGLEVDGYGFVVRAPQGDTWMVTELIDEASCLGERLFADTVNEPVLDGEILPKEEALAVGRLVHFGAADMCMDAEHVEVGVERELYVALKILRRRLGERCRGRTLIRTHDEQLLRR